MFCKNCGKEVSDNAVVCIHCGAAIDKNPTRTLSGESKTGLGALLGVFLGIIGLIIGLCMYPAESVERKTFIKGWGIAFAISVVIGIILYSTVFASLFATMNYYY